MSPSTTCSKPSAAARFFKSCDATESMHDTSARVGIERFSNVSTSSRLGWCSTPATRMGRLSHDAADFAWAHKCCTPSPAARVLPCRRSGPVAPCNVPWESWRRTPLCAPSGRPSALDDIRDEESARAAWISATSLTYCHRGFAASYLFTPHHPSIRNRACTHIRFGTTSLICLSYSGIKFSSRRAPWQDPARSGIQGEGNTCRVECVCSPYCARSCDHRDKKQPRHHRGLFMPVLAYRSRIFVFSSV
jgi:hypothetical protein